MHTTRLIAPLFLLTLASITGCDRKEASAAASRDTTQATASTNTTAPTPAADNTARNKSDAGADTKTPMDQSQASADIDITANIRRAIMNDKAMSINAQNCKIITEKAGMVTLRGVVNSQAEKDSIEAKAKAVAGVAKVDNQLEVKAN
ncbi:MAG: BON domain-containing protein [Phycisphaerales bacterium]